MLDTDRLDPYVLWVLEKNGWTPERVFPQSAAWTAEIERLGHPPFDYGVQVLRSLGGLRFREYHPRSYQKLVQGWRERGLPLERWPKAADIRRKCEASLSALQRLGLDPDRYNGATFTFDALDAARDEEVVLDHRQAAVPHRDGGARRAGFHRPGPRHLCAVQRRYFLLRALCGGIFAYSFPPGASAGGGLSY